MPIAPHRPPGDAPTNPSPTARPAITLTVVTAATRGSVPSEQVRLSVRDRATFSIRLLALVPNHPMNPPGPVSVAARRCTSWAGGLLAKRYATHENEMTSIIRQAALVLALLCAILAKSYAADDVQTCFKKLSDSRSPVEFYVDDKTYIQRASSEFGLSGSATAILDRPAFPKAATLCTGHIAVVWENAIFGPHGVLSKTSSFSGRVLDAQFHQDISDFLIAEPETYAGPYTIAGLMNGGFVVAWQELTKTGARSRVRVFDLSGKPLARPFDLSDGNKDSYSPRVYALPKAGFVALWVTAAGIKLRIFDNGARPKSKALLLDPLDVSAPLEWQPFGYVTDNGTINVFLRRSDDPGVDFYTGPHTTPFQLALSFDSNGNPITGATKTLPEMRSLLGYQHVVEQLVELTASHLDVALRALLRSPGLNYCGWDYQLRMAVSRKKLSESPRMKAYFTKYCSLWHERCPTNFHGYLEQQYDECTSSE